MAEKPTTVPAPRLATIRQSLTLLLRQGAYSSLELSELVGIAEKEVYGHLRHIRHSLQHEGVTFKVLPAECLQCGFVFAKRQRLKKPGRCPLCHAETISRPRYQLSD